MEKLKTGIQGFDEIALGGLPRNRMTLVSGTAGSGKTIVAMQFLVEGILMGENGVFVTFEESISDMKKNMRGFGWELEKLEEEGRLAFVDASPMPEHERIIAGSYDLGALLARIESAIKKIQARRISLDSLGAIFNTFEVKQIVRSELFRISAALKKLGVTSILTAEREHEHGIVGRYGVEEFVADNVILLRNALEDEKRRRTIEILKFRGAPHQKGEYSFTILPENGLVMLPISSIQLKQNSSDIRISSGNGHLDRMCNGGFFRDSIILISGATGTGKTLTVTEFMAGGVKNGEKCLLFAFEESRDQLVRNATGWGIDYKAMEAEGKLKVVCEYPEVKGLEDHLIHMREIIDEFKPNRVAIDSLSALERVAPAKGFREFVISLTSFIKHQEMAGLFTSTTPTLMGGSSITETNISTITDLIILLRYVETYGEMKRGITVLKMRGSIHDKQIRQFTIDGKGMHIGNAFRDITGIISGHPTYANPGEIERMDKLFKEG